MEDLQRLAAQKILNLIDQALSLGQIDQAIVMLEQNCQQWHDLPDIQAMMVKAYLMAGQPTKALLACRKLSEVDPENPIAVTQLGILELQNGRPDLAKPALQRATELYPDDLSIQKWLAHACHETGELEQAILCYEKALSAESPPEEVKLPLAFAYRNMADLKRSNILLKEVLTEQPEHLVAGFTLAQNQLLAGDLENGLKGYEARWTQDLPEKLQLKIPLWQSGVALEGKGILVFDEQGFGDCIMFARFLPHLCDVAGRVKLRLRPKLHQLLSPLLENCELVSDLGEEADFALPMMSLPYALGLIRQDIETDFSHAYLKPSLERVEMWEDRLKLSASHGKERDKKVGIIWQGDPNSPAEQGRSMEFEDILPLFQQKDCQFFLLQMSDGRDRFKGCDLPDNVVDLGADLDRDGHAFVDTAAVMASMDVVISSDTATAHLAGALGVESWTLLKFVPEWRWEMAGDTSYWYDKMRLFRQKSRGDWDGVVQDVAAALTSVDITN